MDFKQQDMIDSYLRGDLSGSELASFENQMQIDPAFKEEVLFEEYVKDGISEFRKAELKSRLNAIEVSPNWVGIGSFGNDVVLKTVGGTLAAVMLGVVAYYNLDKTTPTEKLTEQTYITGAYYPEQNDSPAIIVPELAKETIEEAAYVARIDKDPLVTELKENPAEDSKEVMSSETDLDKENADFVPKVSPPGLNDVASEEAMNTEELVIPEVSSLDEMDGDNVPLDVKMIDRRSETIRYKYLDGKLYLYGDFSKHPYEILEINKANDRRIYVYYDSEYYQVEVTDKVEELPVIRNEKLIEELEILRNNKLTE